MSEFLTTERSWSHRNEDIWSGFCFHFTIGSNCGCPRLERSRFEPAGSAKRTIGSGTTL